MEFKYKHKNLSKKGKYLNPVVQSSDLQIVKGPIITQNDRRIVKGKGLG